MSIQTFPHIKDLWDRLTSTRAGYLDNLNGLTAANLDTTVSSRSTSTEVAKATVCTDARLAALEGGAALKTPAINITTARAYDDSSTQSAEVLGVPEFSDSIVGVHSVGWRNIVTCSATSVGTIQFCAVQMTNFGSAESDGRIRLVVDGNTIITSEAASLATNDERGVSLVGLFGWETFFGCATGSVPFKTSFAVDWYTGSSGSSYSMSVKCWLQYYLVSGNLAA